MISGIPNVPILEGSLNPKNGLTLSSLAVAILMLAALALAAGCSNQSANIGKYYKGRVLHLNVAAMERTDELRWTTSTRAPQQGATGDEFFRLTPESSANELVLLRVKVENHTATNAIVSVDHESAQLRDFLQGRYYPINVSERAEDAGIPESQQERCNVPVDPEEHRLCVRFLWNATHIETSPDGEPIFVERAQELPKGFGLNGWMVFEVPRGTQFRSFRWSAGDTISIDF